MGASFSLLHDALTAVALAVVVWGAALLVRRQIRLASSPLVSLPGPKRGSWLKGNFSNTNEFGATRLEERWFRQYGHVIRYYSNFGVEKMMTSDAKAASYILSHPDIFNKSEGARRLLSSVLGKGLLFAVGDDHRKQRKVMNPAFGPVQISKFTETFLEKALELRDILASKAALSTRKDGKYRVNACSWLNRATLDIIGLTGFGYSFNALRLPEDQPDELYTAISTALVSPGNGRSLFRAFQAMFPPAMLIPTPQLRRVAHSQQVIRRIGMQIIADKKAAALARAGDDSKISKEDFEDRDLISLLIRSNIAVDIPESMRMTDEEILGQVPTFLIAGHETTSTAMAWALFVLCIHPSVQARLREELLDSPSDTPTMDELNNLKYLDSFVREVLRLYAPVSATHRKVTQDAVVPLEKPFVDAKGLKRNDIRLNAGDVVAIPIRIINRSIEIWGEDANEFRPERWDDLPEAVHSVPGVFSHMLTFLGGARACIGYRFSIVETKALLFTLVRAFEFELAVSPDDIVRKTQVVGRPWIDGEGSTEPEMPILIRPVKV